MSTYQPHEHPEMLHALWRVWDSPMTTKAGLTKTHADQIAIAACEGLITVRVGSGYGRIWRITPRGLQILLPHLDQMDIDTQHPEPEEDDVAPYHE